MGLSLTGCAVAAMVFIVLSRLQVAKPAIWGLIVEALAIPEELALPD